MTRSLKKGFIAAATVMAIFSFQGFAVEENDTVESEPTEEELILIQMQSCPKFPDCA